MDKMVAFCDKFVSVGISPGNFSPSNHDEFEFESWWIQRESHKRVLISAVYPFPPIKPRVQLDGVYRVV